MDLEELLHKPIWSDGAASRDASGKALSSTPSAGK